MSFNCNGYYIALNIMISVNCEVEKNCKKPVMACFKLG